MAARSTEDARHVPRRHDDSLLRWPVALLAPPAPSAQVRGRFHRRHRSSLRGAGASRWPQCSRGRYRLSYSSAASQVTRSTGARRATSGFVERQQREDVDVPRSARPEVAPVEGRELRLAEPLGHGEDGGVDEADVGVGVPVAELTNAAAAARSRSSRGPAIDRMVRSTASRWRMRCHLHAAASSLAGSSPTVAAPMAADDEAPNARGTAAQSGPQAGETSSWTERGKSYRTRAYNLVIKSRT